jgi:Tol biopolymer transport system component
MDFVPCPRCQEMNPPNETRCTACGASLDEAPIEVAPLTFAEEEETDTEAAETPADAAVEAPQATAAPPLPTPAAPPAEAVPAPAAPASTPVPSPTRAAAEPAADLPPALAAEVAALRGQIRARPEGRAPYLKLCEIYQHVGNKDAAVAALEELLAVDPGNALARHRIDVLRGTVQHQARPVASVHPVSRPARPARRAPRRRPVAVWIGLAAALVLAVAGVLWLFSGPKRLVAGQGPVLSPRGDQIAFMTDGDPAELRVYDFDSGKERAIGKVSAFAGPSAYTFSPDGRKLAFVGAGEDFGDESVFVADLESGATQHLASGSEPTFSPDGQSIAMLCQERPRVSASMVTEDGEIPTGFTEGWLGVCTVGIADGSTRRLLAGSASHLAFSPRARTIVLERPPEEWPEAPGGSVPGGGGDDELQALADEAVAGGATNFYEGSRDLGRAIEARGLDKRGAQGVGFVAGDILVLDADTGAVTALTRDGRSTSPRWTSDGRIVYVHQPPGAPQAGLWTMGADGSGQQAYGQAPVELFDPAAVAVGGDKVVFAAPIKDVNTGLARVMTGEEAADLHVLRPGDKAARRLKNRHTFKQRFSLSSDGRRLVYEVRDARTGRSELWLMKP